VTGPARPSRRRRLNATGSPPGRHRVARTHPSVLDRDPDADPLAAAGLTGTTVFVTPVRETMLPAAEEAAGALTVDIETVLPLKQATDGLATLAAGKAKGKVVVNLDVCTGTPPSRALSTARR
jgi:hypothetical protein